jgi:hypothetical protein
MLYKTPLTFDPSLRLLPSIQPSNRYKSDTSIYSSIGTNKRNAIVDRMKRSTPFVLALAKEIRNDAPTINPMAIKDAHILSIELIRPAPNLYFPIL